MRWTHLWIAWAALGTAIEVAALVGKRAPRDTLSRNIQALAMVDHPKVRRVTLAGWLGFSAWFAWHIWG